MALFALASVTLSDGPLYPSWRLRGGMRGSYVPYNSCISIRSSLHPCFLVVHSTPGARVQLTVYLQTFSITLIHSSNPPQSPWSSPETHPTIPRTISSSTRERGQTYKPTNTNPIRMNLAAGSTLHFKRIKVIILLAVKWAEVRNSSSKQSKSAKYEPKVSAHR